MKKITILILALITTTVFAQPFSKQKLKNLKDEQRYKYCYQAQISKQSNYQHILNYANYIKHVQNKTMTQNQLQQLMKKFNGVFNQLVYIEIKGQIAAQFDLYNVAINCFNKTKSRYILQRLQQKHRTQLIKGNFYWQAMKYILLQNGGNANAKLAMTVISKGFRFKCKQVTKQQQIEVLTQIADMYPIPGTDFNQWKGFMGFVGFKYKQLTGKDLL